MNATTTAANGTFAAYDDSIIWGTGATAEAAMSDAAQWVDDDGGIELLRTCKTAAMTPELAALVDAMGGNVGFVLLADGRLGTSDQHTAHEAISLSVQQNSIPRVLRTEANYDALAADCDDYVDAPNGTEFWGTDEDGHGWRVHMPY